MVLELKLRFLRVSRVGRVLGGIFFGLVKRRDGL